jgi:hypothetical protein
MQRSAAGFGFGRPCGLNLLRKLAYAATSPLCGRVVNPRRVQSLTTLSATNKNGTTGVPFLFVGGAAATE